jgi:hypothetical protein
MNGSNLISRDDFMNFFRSDDSLNTLSSDDRIEIFRTILLGSSDFTKELLEEVLSDYSVSKLRVININDNHE